MILVYCYTNIDAAQWHQWPEEMCVRPVLGDFVEALTEGPFSIMKVVQITHSQKKEHTEIGYRYVPYLRVELGRVF